MKFSGLLIEGQRKIGGGRLLTYFVVPVGDEDLAVSDILAVLAEGYVVTLNNDLDEGHEGVTELRITPSGLEMMTSGHGWRSKWKQTDEVEVAATVKSLAHLNRGGHWSKRGSFTTVG